jgi:hypothetical protein
LIDEGQRNGGDVEDHRDLFLAIGACRSGEGSVVAMQPMQHDDQNEVGGRAKRQDNTVNGDRHRREMVFTHEGRGHGHQRQPEQQMQIGPQHAAIDPLHGVEHVVQIVPVDADIDEGQHVAEKSGP